MPIALLTTVLAFVTAVIALVRRRRRHVRLTLVDDREHRARVNGVARQLRERKSTAPVRFKKKTVSHQVPKRRDSKYVDDHIDISALTGIISIDPIRHTCTAESGVAFVDLVEATMRFGLVPIVVPELKTITVGGAVTGCSIESMSFRYGGFHDTCLEYEVITAAGDVVVCTPGEPLFEMMHGSFGTLGVLARLTFKLVPAKRYVKLTYEKHGNLGDYLAAIERHYRVRDIDFMDGIIHSPKEYVLSTGRFVDNAPYTSRYDWMKAYHESTRERVEDYLCVADYFFRYDRGVTQVHPKSKVGRFFFGKFIGSSEVLRIAEKFPVLLDDDKPTVVVDLFLPLSRVPAFLEWYEKELGHYPLWVVPYKRVRDYEWIHPRVFAGVSDELFVDIAVYGLKQTGEKNVHRLFEQKLAELNGIKTLISHNYYEPDEFWRTWNRESYDAVKRVTDPNNIFRDLYEKTCLAPRGITSRTSDRGSAP